MFEVRAVFKIALILVKLDNFDLVLQVFAVRAKSEAEVLLLSVAEIYCIERPLSLMCVYLFAFPRLSPS